MTTSDEATTSRAPLRRHRHHQRRPHTRGSDDVLTRNGRPQWIDTRCGDGADNPAHLPAPEPTRFWRWPSNNSHLPQRDGAAPDRPRPRATTVPAESLGQLCRSRGPRSPGRGTVRYRTSSRTRLLQTGVDEAAGSVAWGSFLDTRSFAARDVQLARPLPHSRDPVYGHPQSADPRHGVVRDAMSDFRARHHAVEYRPRHPRSRSRMRSGAWRRASERGSNPRT